MRKQKSGESQSDLAQAIAIWPQVADEFKPLGNRSLREAQKEARISSRGRARGLQSI
jgi:hypothetical protein